MTRPLLPRDLLRPQQLEIADLIRRHKALMVVLRMGGGKTGAVLTTLLDMLDRFEIRRVLVVAPLRVARDTWPDEVRAWEHTRLMSVAVAIGNKATREEAVDRKAEITVINFENLTWLYEYVGGARGWPFDCLVIDESSQFKAGKKRTTTTKSRGMRNVWVVVRKDNGKEVPEAPVFTDWQEAVAWIEDDGRPGLDLKKTKRMMTRVTKGGRLTRFGALARVRKKVDRVIELTGTPAPGGVHDLWGQVYLLDQGQRLGSTLTEFEDRYFTKNTYSYEIKPKPGAEAEIMSRIDDVMFSFPPPADLPEPTFVPVRVDLKPSVLDEYVRFKRNMVSEIHDVEAVSRGVLTMKLLQFANGSMYREDRSIAKIHDEKLGALDDLITRAAGDPMLVFYGFRFDLDEIRRIYPKAVLLSEDESAVRRWNNGEIKVLVAHPRSCAHGLNLQFGGHLGVWYGLTWSLELYQQANARLARPGQKHPVAMYQILANGTDDDRVLEVLEARNATQEDITEAVRLAIVNS